MPGVHEVKKYRKLPNLRLLRHLFEIDQAGDLIVKNNSGRTAKRKKRGQKATSQKTGYKTVVIDEEQYPAHRVVYKMHYGEEPGQKQVDHINRIRSDNRPENLRLVSNSENLRNRDNGNKPKYGYFGVYPVNGKWVAKVTIKETKKTITVARHKEWLLAVCARQHADIILGGAKATKWSRSQSERKKLGLSSHLTGGSFDQFGPELQRKILEQSLSVPQVLKRELPKKRAVLTNRPIPRIRFRKT